MTVDPLYMLHKCETIKKIEVSFVQGDFNTFRFRYQKITSSNFDLQY